ncbi:hypothetical protein CHUAL_012387 [Chamberlinius hualienensis]
MSEEEPNKPKDPPCTKVRNELKECLLESECMRKGKKSAKQCLIDHGKDVPDECYRLQYALFQCKRSLLDTRQRFRGRKDY